MIEDRIGKSALSQATRNRQQFSIIEYIGQLTVDAVQALWVWYTIKLNNVTKGGVYLVDSTTHSFICGNQIARDQNTLVG